MYIKIINFNYWKNNTLIIVFSSSSWIKLLFLFTLCSTHILLLLVIKVKRLKFQILNLLCLSKNQFH